MISRLCADAMSGSACAEMVTAYKEARFAQLVLAGSLAVMTQDILHSLVLDYHVLARRKFTFASFTFLFSRITTLLYLIFSIVVIRNVISDIEEKSILQTLSSSRSTTAILSITASVLYVLARSSTALLLYFRVRAVYAGALGVSVFFGVTWIAVVVGNVFSFGPSIKGTGTLGNTRNHLRSFLVAGVSVLLNDTLVYAAIAWKLRAGEMEEGGQARWKSVFGWRRVGIQRFTDVFLQDSHIFYLFSVGATLAMIISYFATFHSGTGSVVVVFPTTAAVNIMATIVHRNLLLGRPGLMFREKTTFGLGGLSFVQSVVSGNINPGGPQMAQNEPVSITPHPSFHVIGGDLTRTPSGWDEDLEALGAHNRKGSDSDTVIIDSSSNSSESVHDVAPNPQSV